VRSIVRSPKDFWAGAIYVVIGVAAIVLGLDYPMGTVLRMGPGYFPSVLGALLALIGALSLLRSFLRPGEPIGGVALKGLLVVVGATLLAGLLIRRTGVAVALPLLVIVSACASSRFRWRTTLALAAGITVFCALVFVKGLGVPLPIVGPLLGG
jgi:putative tricarboxylic transport membrane protein